MLFPWNKYEELSLSRRNTLQIFITNKCNTKCSGCFARNIIKENDRHIDIEDYLKILRIGRWKGAQQVNLLGGEPLLHPIILQLLTANAYYKYNTTIYTNGYLINKFKQRDFDLTRTKLRVSLYSFLGKAKSVVALPKTDNKFDANFMVSINTTCKELLDSAEYLENCFKGCKTFFISSLRELDNPRKEFFDDTSLTMPVVEYKELVHRFLDNYRGNLDIHVSKRGVFESTKTLPDRKCRFANYFVDGKIIQCPYDIVNLKFQKDFEFGQRNCQHNNTCLMSKVKYRRIDD